MTVSPSSIITPIDGSADDFFGTSIGLSADGRTAIVGGIQDDVGSNADQGSARVFDFNGDTWVQRGGALTPSDGDAGDFFGRAVALSADGQTAIVGGDLDDVGPNTVQGSARVFDWNGTAWVQRGDAVTPIDGASGDQFGLSVDLSADGLTAIIGGPGDTVGSNFQQGSARVFDWNGSAWVQRGGVVTPTVADASSYFGESVALSSDGLTAIISGRGDNHSRGSARVFDWDGSAWIERGKPLKRTPAEIGAHYGETVAMSADGNTAIVGGGGSSGDGGAAFVFAWDGTAWVHRGGLLTDFGDTPHESNFFGAAVAMSADGQTVIVGAPFDDIGSNTHQGSARVFDWDGTTYRQRGELLTPSDGQANDAFGGAVAISDDGLTAFIGGYGDDIGPNAEQGSVRMFTWDGTAWRDSSTAAFLGTAGNDTLTGTAADDSFDISQGGTDTVDGLDGNDTIAVGAALDAADRIDGGAGNDALKLYGDYSAGIVLDALTIVNIETLSVEAGHARITADDGSVAAGQRLVVSATGLAQLDFDGSAETDGSFEFMAGGKDDVLVGGSQDDGFRLASGGDDLLAGGGGSDAFYVTAGFTPADRLGGGAGNDIVYLSQALGSGMLFDAQTIAGIETIKLKTGHGYTLATNDGNVGAGGYLKVLGQSLRGDEIVRFNGSAETDGRFIVTGGAAADALRGGAMNDTLTGGNGDDRLTGGDGDDKLSGGNGRDVLTGGLGGDYLYGSGDNDKFVFTQTAESTVTDFDWIRAWTVGDRVDLSAIDADTNQAGNQAFTYIGAASFSGAGQLQVTASGTANTIIRGDVDGDGTADLLIKLAGDPGLGAGSFVL